jgi:uncharacterized membrane protein YhaH (DUF805 family)
MVSHYLKAILGALVTAASIGFLAPFIAYLFGARKIQYDRYIILNIDVAVVALIIGVVLFVANARLIVKRMRP